MRTKDWARVSALVCARAGARERACRAMAKKTLLPPLAVSTLRPILLRHAEGCSLGDRERVLARARAALERATLWRGTAKPRRAWRRKKKNTARVPAKRAARTRAPPHSLVQLPQDTTRSIDAPTAASSVPAASRTQHTSTPRRPRHRLLARSRSLARAATRAQTHALARRQHHLRPPPASARHHGQGEEDAQVCRGQAHAQPQRPQVRASFSSCGLPWWWRCCATRTAH